MYKGFVCFASISGITGEYAVQMFWRHVGGSCIALLMYCVRILFYFLFLFVG